jgi:tetratricopeptide (TPR) repeat protein
MIDISPEAQPFMQRGGVLYAQQDYEGARQEFAAALAVQADLTPAKFNLAVIMRELEENESAEAMFHEVIASGEIVAESENNLGILAVRKEAFDEAVAHFRQAIQLCHQFPLAHFNLGTLLLRLGQYVEGWKEYEWRWQTPTFTPLNCPQPRWDGEQLDGTLLLHTEQGIGDVFQYARFIPMIRERCQQVLFVRPEAMDCMFPAELWADDIRSPGEIRLDSFQAVLPLMSATHVFQTKLEDLPSGENYLTPVQRDVPLGPSHVANAKLKVGITWGGSPTHVNDAFRSMTLDQFKPLFEIPEVAFYSLQIGPRTQEIEALGPQASVIRDLSELQSDFADTAAIVRQLDLVITVDTSLLHLSGGLGLPAWGLISRRGDWRWLGNDQTETPWYSSVKLFRQNTLNDWNEVMARVAKELELRAKAAS